MKVELIKYYIERFYPYLLAVICFILAVRYKVNYITSISLSDALNACNTAVALIIGFLGTILPVILGMKNESKIVKYVFDRDKNKLFLKYIKATIFWGILTLVVTMSLYFANDYQVKVITNYMFYIWIFLVTLFLGLTYRSLRSMLDLVFLSDDELKSNKNIKTPEKAKRDAEIEAEFAVDDKNK